MARESRAIVTLESRLSRVEITLTQGYLEPSYPSHFLRQLFWGFRFPLQECALFVSYDNRAARCEEIALAGVHHPTIEESFDLKYHFKVMNLNRLVLESCRRGIQTLDIAMHS